MTKFSAHSWTPDKLATKTRKEVETIRKNAIRLGVSDLIELCDNDLVGRSPQKGARVQRTQASHTDIDVVTGYHFVCQRDRGVTNIEDGRFWSGSWVVAEANVRTSIKYGAYLALHESKSEMSYRQGQVLDYRRSPRDMLSPAEGDKTESGIEFLVQGTDKPYAWVGAGAGEKGYQWTKLVAAISSEVAGNEVPQR